MSAKNANNNAENAKNGKAAKSMTEHYTLGHKAVAVAMSTVMLGFGVPVNAPKDAYADTDAAAEQQADSDSASAKKSTEDTSAKKAESTKATDSSSASSSSSAATQNNNGSKADSSSAKDAAKTDTKAETKTTADVKLSLGNASIKHQGQTIAAPTTKVTVPTKNAFKFTVAADNGYTLSKVTVKVSGKESTLTADGNGVYTVAAADVATGASIKLVTEKQVQAQPAADTTPIENTETQAPAASQPAAGQAAGGDSSADAGNNQSASGDAGNQESTAENADESGESSDQQGGEEANGNETSHDEAAADGQSEDETNESDVAQLQMLGSELTSVFAAANGNVIASYDMVIGNGQQQITAAGYNGNYDWTITHTWTSSDENVASVSSNWANAWVTAKKAGTTVITDTVTKKQQDRRGNWNTSVVATYTYQVNVSDVSVKITGGPTQILLGDTGTFTCEANVPISAWMVDGDGKGAFSPNYQATTDKQMTFTANRGWNFNGDSTTVNIKIQYGNGQTSEPYTVTLMKRSFTVSEPPVFTDENADHYWVPTLRDAVTGEVIDKSKVTNANYEIKYYKNGNYVGNQDDVQSKSYWNHQKGDDEHSLYGPGDYTVEVISNSGWEYKTGTTTIAVPDKTELKQFNTDNPKDYVYEATLISGRLR